MKRVLSADISLIPCVAPRAGAWIETYSSTIAGIIGISSPPARGRGLKLVVLCLPESSLSSPPARGRGLKQIRENGIIYYAGRPPRGGVD